MAAEEAAQVGGCDAKFIWRGVRETGWRLDDVLWSFFPASFFRAMAAGLACNGSWTAVRWELD
jgi:hypothetical protein